MTLRVPPNPTVDDCWKELQPIAIKFTKFVRTAPLPPNEKAGLAMLFLTHAIATAATEFQAWRDGKGSFESHAREAVDLALASAFKAKKPNLTIVPTPTPQEPDAHD